MASFEYEQRTEKLTHLVRDTLQHLTLSSTPNIIFHYSAKFSREDRAAILEVARGIRPQGIYTFVWVNSDHNVYLFDSRAETDGSMRRGSYVQISPHELFLSTTGYSAFRRTMGTPRPIQITAWVDRPEGVLPAPPDMKSLAVQVLSLTKLNWASTDAFCGEPTTLKYAGDIAYLTAAFMRQAEQFKLHPR
jgi:argonaute-like protein implicated in RNA metabolism and viral defense